MRAKPVSSLVIAVLLLFSAAPATVARAKGASPSAAQRYAVLMRTQRQFADGKETTNAVATKLRARYDRLFAPTQNARALTQQRTVADVTAIFNAADMLAYWVQDPRYVSDMLLDLNELARRHAASKAEYDDAYEAIVRNRDFSRARAFAARHTLRVRRLPTLMGVRGSTAAMPTYMTISADGSTLTRKAAPVKHGSVVVVVVSPQCHFAQHGLASIAESSELSGALRGHVIWLSPADSTDEFFAVAAWNRAHAREPMELAYRWDEWKTIDDWELPVFYFLKDGSLVDRVTGWPSGGNVPAVKQGLRDIGLL